MLQTQAGQDNAPPRVRDKALVVCVDDFGLDASVDGSVFDLAARGRISATSCLVDGPAFHRDAPRLRDEFGGRLDLGLHLNLSERFSGMPELPGWGALVRKACLRTLDARALQGEVSRQLDAFQRAMGRAPDFIDGHRHVHQLPVVREALLAALEDRGLKPWLRCTCGPRAAGFKAAVIALMGAGPLCRLARRRGFGQNRRMLGVYGFEAATPVAYARLLARWLAAAQDGDLLMCHTALPGGPCGADPIAAARRIEHSVLAAETGARCFAEAHARPARWRDTACGIAFSAGAMPSL